MKPKAYIFDIDGTNGNMKSNLGLTCFQVADGSY